MSPCLSFTIENNLAMTSKICTRKHYDASDLEACLHNFYNSASIKINLQGMVNMDLFGIYTQMLKYKRSVSFKIVLLCCI